MEQEYKFYISLDGTEIEITPGNFNDLKFDIEKPHETCYGFRKVLKGNILIYKGYEYDWLKAVEDSSSRLEELSLRITRLKQGSYVSEYNGYFLLNGCEFNHSRRTVTIKHKPDDAYRGILEGWDREINYLGASLPATIPKIDFNFFNSGDDDEMQLEFSISETNPSSNRAKKVRENAISIGPIDSVDSNYLNQMIYITEVIDPNSQYIKNSIVDELSSWTEYNGEYFRPSGVEFDLNNFVLDLDSNSASYPNHDKVLTISLSGTSYSLFWLVYEHQSISEYQNTRSLTTALKYVINQIDSSIEPVTAAALSDFFSLDTSYINNTANLYKDVRIAQITDVKRPNALSAASTSYFNLKNFHTDMLELGFYWFINSSGKYQLEHWQYFQNPSNTNDLTLSKYEPYVSWKRSIEYIDEELPKVETLEMQNGSRSNLSGNFKGFTVQYTGKEPTTTAERERAVGEENKKERQVRYISFDARDITRNPKKYNDKIDVLLAVDSSGYVSRQASGTLTAVSPDFRFNSYFDFDNMIENLQNSDTFSLPFLQYGRFKKHMVCFDEAGQTNQLPDVGSHIVAQSYLKNKKQETLTVPNFRDVSFDFEGLFETEIGANGSLEKASIDLKTGVLSLELIFPEIIGASAPSFPSVPVYPTDPSFDNECYEEVILIHTDGSALMLTDGDYLDISD